MLAELDVIVFLKIDAAPDEVAARVFGALKSSYEAGHSEEGGVDYFEASGLGFGGTLFANAGNMLDPEFESYGYGLEITSEFWCVELDTVDLEGPLSEYYARMLAFELNIETATEILLETTEDSEVFEIRAYRRNPQFRLDQSPTTPRVFVIETRQVEESYTDEDAEWEDEEVEDEEALAAEVEKEDR